MLSQDQFSRHLRNGDIGKRKDPPKPPGALPETANVAPDAPEEGRAYGQNEAEMHKVETDALKKAQGDNLDQQRNWSRDLKPASSPKGWQGGNPNDPYKDYKQVGVDYGRPATTPRSTTSAGVNASEGTSSSPSRTGSSSHSNGTSQARSEARGPAGWGGLDRGHMPANPANVGTLPPPKPSSSPRKR